MCYIKHIFASACNPVRLHPGGDDQSGDRCDDIACYFICTREGILMKDRSSTKLLTLFSCLLVFVLGQFVAACGGSTTIPANQTVDLTLWAYPSAAEVGNPPPDWFLTKTVREKLNINLKVTF